MQAAADLLSCDVRATVSWLHYHVWGGRAHWASMTSLTAYSTSTPQNPTHFDDHYLRNRSTLDIGVLGYIGIVYHKEHPPEVLSVPPVTPCISTLHWVWWLDLSFCSAVILSFMCETEIIAVFMILLISAWTSTSTSSPSFGFVRSKHLAKPC